MLPVTVDRDQKSEQEELEAKRALTRRFAELFSGLSRALEWATPDVTETPPPGPPPLPIDRDQKSEQEELEAGDLLARQGAWHIQDLLNLERILCAHVFDVADRIRRHPGIALRMAEREAQRA